MAKTPAGPGSWEASQLPLDVSGTPCEFGHANPSGATYCGTCGVGLEAPPPGHASASRPRSRGFSDRLRGALGRFSGNNAK
jgi:hypothetical protein